MSTAVQILKTSAASLKSESGLNSLEKPIPERFLHREKKHQYSIYYLLSNNKVQPNKNIMIYNSHPNATRNLIF